MKKLLPTLLIFLLLAGCAATLQSDGNPGSYPSNYENTIDQYIKSRLKDPYTVRDLNIQRPFSCERWVGIQNGGKISGYCVLASFNAKNSFGAYVGLRKYTFLIKHGQVIWTTFR